MDFELYWLLIAVPVVFALGWMASRTDLRQLGRTDRSAPKAYFKGLNLLLNEQHDKAIDAFIEAVQQDPDTTELHFGLGNLFRRRGDFERAVRVHEHLLGRAGLKPADRARAQQALAADFMKAGLFDRAAAAYRALEGTVFDHEARLALLSLLERARDWPAATAAAQALEQRGGGSFATRIAHYACELAIEADAREQPLAAEQHLQQARAAAPQAVRPALLAGQRLASTGQHAQALQTWDGLIDEHPAAWPLVALDYARSASPAGRADAARAALRKAGEADPDPNLLQARLELEAADADRRRLVLDHLKHHPGLTAAAKALELPEAGTDADTRQRLHAIVSAAAVPMQRYRCAACGFETQRYFWQCPGCQGWDTYPPRRMESL